jgi:hypothetical protein
LNVHTDHDPPKWIDLFESIPRESVKLVSEIFNVNMDPSGDDTQFTMTIPHGVPPEEIVIDYFNDLEEELERDWRENWEANELSESDDDNDYYYPPIEGSNTNTPIMSKKEIASKILQIIDGVMETESQKLDQGIYLELCRLLRDLHQ